MSLLNRFENSSNNNTLLNPTNARSGPTAIGGRRISTIDSESVALRIYYGDTKQPKIIPLVVDREIPLKTHIGCILEKFNIPGQPALFALYHPGSNSYIQQADLKDKKKFDALRGEEVHLKINPTFQSNKTLVDIEQTIRELFSYSKKAIFDLIKKLQVMFWLVIISTVLTPLSEQELCRGVWQARRHEISDPKDSRVLRQHTGLRTQCSAVISHNSCGLRVCECVFCAELVRHGIDARAELERVA